MKNTIIATIPLLVLMTFTSFKNEVIPEPIAVIELFTSQGCSSCPAADRLLSKTMADVKKNGQKIFALSFHVDYWNYLGWADPFSRAEFTKRQRAYISKLNVSSAYTPQMVINGATEFIGSDEKALGNALRNSLTIKSLVNFKTLTFSSEPGKAPHLKYELDGNFGGSKLNFALVSVSETTNVTRGENAGRVLSSENVVYEFVSIQAAAYGEFDFTTSHVPANDKLAIIAYVQQADNLKIIGAGMATRTL